MVCSKVATVKHSDLNYSFCILGSCLHFLYFLPNFHLCYSAVITSIPPFQMCAYMWVHLLVGMVEVKNSDTTAAEI